MDFRDSRGSHESFNDISFLNGWRQFRIDEAASKKSGRVGSRIVHSVCTGNAERQLAVLVVGRWSLVVCRSSVMVGLRMRHRRIALCVELFAALWGLLFFCW
jgi:hypothetical protein